MSTKNQEELDQVDAQLEKLDVWESAKDIDDFSEYKLGEEREDQPPVEAEEKEDKPIAKAEDFDNDDEMLESDFENARQNILNITNRSDEILDEAIEMAKTSDHPRTFEVVGELMQKMVNMNKDLMTLYSEKNKNKKNKGPEEKTQNNTQNNYFYGSTSDLQQKLKEVPHPSSNIESEDPGE